MKLNIDFDDLVTAFEESDVSKHYFIGTKEDRLIYINEEIEDNASEKLESMKDERYIHIPSRMPQDDFLIIESFVYEIAENDFNLAERFHEALERTKPFRNFKVLLEQHPELKERWFKYKTNHFRNEAINWLLENNIELENQKLIPDVEIVELESMEYLPKEIKEELKGFGPVACMSCHNKEGLIARLFLINAPPENKLIENETKRIMREKYEIGHFGNYTGGEKELLTASKCPKCNSEDIIWDY